MKKLLPTVRLSLITLWLISPSCLLAFSGDRGAWEPGLKNRPDILFFGGFESEPWTSSWGMAWGPDPLDHGTLLGGPDAFEGRSLRVKYLKDGFGPQAGFQFLTDLNKINIVPRESLYLRYYLRFEPGFDFVKGGKLPGLAGGKGNTGGHKPNGSDGWSARMMWRADGKIVQYVYHPDQPTEYGEDFVWDYGGCPRYFKPGRWYCVETYVQMNSPGKKDGIIRSWLDGDKALEVTNIRFRDIPTIKIDKLYVETFFGGGDASWSSPGEVYADFDNFVMASNYIGPEPGREPQAIARTSGATGSSAPTTGLLVFDGDHPEWSVSSWSDGIYDFKSRTENHTIGGGQSVRVELPDGKWGAVQFEGPAVNLSDYKKISLWVFPTSCNVEFRVRLESNGKQTGVEKAVTGARGWEIGRWNEVEIPLADFQAADSFNKIVLNSNSPKAVAPFYVDDLWLEK